MRKALVVVLLLAVGCDPNLPGKPDPAKREKPPDQIVNFDELYSRNCAGCHGKDGVYGPAPPLNDPLFLAIVKDSDLEKAIRHGRPGTPMPGFEKTRGGPLTEKQIGIVAQGLKEHWGKAKVDVTGVPAYAPSAAAGDPQMGEKVYARACKGCHGKDGKGGKYKDRTVGAIHEPAFLGLISDQALRRLVITGRPDLGMPDFAGKAGRSENYRPLTESDLSDLMALLARWRQPSSEDARP